MASLVASGTGSAFGTLRTGIVSLYSPPGGRRGHLFLRSTATISLSTVVSSLVWHTARHLGIVLVASPSTSGIGAIELAIVNAAGWFIAFVLLIEYYAAAWPRTFSWRVPSSNTHRGKPLHYRHLKQKHDNRISNALQSSTGVVPGASQSGPVSSALWFGSNGLASEASVRYPPSPPSGASTVRGGMRRKSSTASSNGDVFTPPPPSLPAVNVVADQSADLARPPRSSLNPPQHSILESGAPPPSPAAAATAAIATPPPSLLNVLAPGEGALLRRPHEPATLLSPVQNGSYFFSQMGRSPPATSAAAAAIPGSPSLVRRGSSYGAVLNSVSQPPSALTPNFVVYLITAVVMVFMVFSIVIQANIGTGAATSTQSIPITWQRMFVTRQSAMFVTVSILIPFLLRVYGARRHRSMGTAKVWTPIVPALTFNVTMITCVIFEKTWAFAGLIFGFLMTQIAFVVVLVRVSSRAGGMSWLKQHLDLVHLFFFSLWVYYGIDRGYELFLKWTLQNNFATRGLIGNAVLRILTAVFMSINELAVELVFGRRDLWVVFPHRALDDMTIIALTLTSQAFGSTDAINIGQYGLVTALIAFGRDCFVTNDLWFALRFDLSLTDLYPSWTASDRDLLASPLLIASSTAAMKESGTAAAMSTNASESASNRSKRDLGDNRSRMSSLALQLPFPQWVKTLHAVAQNPLADEHLGSIVFDDILENNNDNRSFIVLANGGSGSGGGEMRTFMPLTTGAIPQGKQPTITANSSKSDVSLGIIKLDIMSSALLAAVSPPSAITGSGLAQGDALSNSIGGAAGTTDDRGSLGSDADLECARGSTAPPSSPKSRYLSSAPPSPDLTTSGLPQQGASMGVRNRSLSMPSRVANSSPPTATLKRVQESGKAATPPSSHSGGSTDSPTLSRRSGPRSTDHISVDYPSSTPPRRPSTRSSVLSAGTGGSATVESAEIVPSPLPVMLIAPVADDGHPPSDNSGAQSPIIRASVANGGGGGGFLKVQRRLSIVRSGSEIQDRDTPDHAIIQLPPTLLSQAVYSTSLSRGTGAVVGGGEGDLPVSAVNKRQSLESVGAAAATATNTSTTTTTTSVPPLRPRLASSGSVTGQSPLRETLRRNATLTRRAGLGTTTATPGPLPSTSVPSGTAPPVAALTTTTSIPPIPPRLVAWHAQLRSQVERLQHTLLARLVSMAAYAAVVGAEASLGVTALQTQVPLLAVIVGAGIGAALVAMGIVYLKVRGMRALVAAWSVSAALAGGFGGAAASRLPSVVVLDDEGSIRGTGTGGRAVAHSYSVPALLSSNVTGLHHAPGGGGWTAAMVAEQLRPIEFWNANLSTSISPRLVYIGIALVTFLRFGILSISWSAPALPTP